MIVYKITNKINDKVYIGITTTTLQKRWSGHLKRCKIGDTRHLYCAMRKYGVDNFCMEQIDTASSYEELLEKEKYYINLFSTRVDGYNMTEGGDTNPMDDEEVIKKHNTKMRSKEVREKISKTMKQKAAQGILFSESHKQHLRESAMGNHNFGSGDTRSIGCYCILLNTDTKIEFHSIKEAGKWWYDTYQPFGTTYSTATYQRKIEKSMMGEEIEYGNKNHKNYIHITNIKWFKGGSK